MLIVLIVIIIRVFCSFLLVADLLNELVLYQPSNGAFLLTCSVVVLPEVVPDVQSCSQQLPERVRLRLEVVVP